MVIVPLLGVNFSELLKKLVIIYLILLTSKFTSVKSYKFSLSSIITLKQIFFLFA
jgi:hypothetical protein